MISKGAGASISGKKYEIQIYNIIKKCKLTKSNDTNITDISNNNNYFNTQDESELGGCSSKNDIECNMNSQRDISIEIKKLKTPDWMQCSLKYDTNILKWIPSERNKIPNESKKIFEDLISNTILFNGDIPPFITKDITHAEWVKIKKNNNNFKDLYIDCPNDTIKQLYNKKECSYIQISNKGLYHLGNDICNFNVPEFICEQKLRVRTKIHKKINSKGFCKLSVMVSCLPKDINKLTNSNYSLDDISRLPNNLVYIN